MTRTLAAAAAALMLMAVAPASAAVTTLDFESGPAINESVTTQYDAQGVVFADGAGGQKGFTPRIARLGALAHSGIRGLGTITQCGTSTEFPVCTTDLWMRFTKSGQAAVRLWAGPTADTAAPSTVTLELFDVSGKSIGSRAVTLDRHAGVRTLVEVQAGGFPCPAAGCAVGAGSAAYAHVYERRTDTNKNSLAIDDLQLYTPAPGAGPAPTFGIARDGFETQYTDEVALLSGGSPVKATIVATRVGPVGPLTFSADTPAGVTADFAPNPSESGTTITLTAAAGTAGADRTPVVVRATRPGAKAGEQSEATMTVPVTVVNHTFDAAITGMVITQGIQPGAGFELAGQGDRTHGYGGVTLAQFGGTYVEVFADAPAGPDGGLDGVTMTLEGTRGDGSALTTPVLVAGPRTLPLRTATTLAEQRRDLSQAFVFQLPKSWTKAGALSITASLHRDTEQPANLFDAEPEGQCTTPQCAENDRFSITGVPFVATYKQFFRGLSMRYHGTVADYGSGRQTDAMTPAGKNDFTIVDQHEGWDVGNIVAACIAFKDGADAQRKCAESQVLNQIADYDEEVRGEAPYTATVGFYEGPVIVGLSRATSRAALVDATRPIASVAHESFHLMLSPHTDTQCGGPAGGSGGSAPATDASGDGGYGSITGAGLNRLDPANPVPVVAPNGHVVGDYTGSKQPFGSAGLAGQFVDLMSYCGLDDDLWISPQQWTRTLGYWTTPGPFGRSARAVSGPAAPGLRVSGYMDDDATPLIATVRPTADAGTAGSPGSPIRLRVLGADGGTTAEVAAAVETSHHDSRTGPPLQEVSFQAEVPMADPGAVSAVQILVNGTPAATRAASAHAPTVDLLTPRGHTGAKPVRVTWKASDADGDPLTFAVDYSADDGATWTPLTRVLDGGQSAVLPGRLFGRSQRARVRVRANDGLREGVAVSGRLRAAGAPPLVTISDPRPGGALVNDHVEALSGYAVDDAGHVVPDRRLLWFAGRRRLGRGGNLSVLGLPAGGRVRLRLVATDRRGRRGSASVVVEVAGHPPRFVELTGRRVGARALRLRVATSIPARLRVTGAHVRRHRSRVGPAARTVRVRLRGRAGRRVRVRLRLSSGRLASKLELTVRRRAG